VQLSAQLCMTKLTAEGTSTVKDKAESITFAPDVFDSYVNPNKAPGLWDEHAIAVHGIAPNQRGGVLPMVSTYLTYKTL
jgi:hypothetical protein